MWGTFESSLPAPRAPVPPGAWRWYPWQAVEGLASCWWCVSDRVSEWCRLASLPSGMLMEMLPLLSASKRRPGAAAKALLVLFVSSVLVSPGNFKLFSPQRKKKSPASNSSCIIQSRLLLPTLPTCRYPGPGPSSRTRTAHNSACFSLSDCPVSTGPRPVGGSSAILANSVCCRLDAVAAQGSRQNPYSPK